MTFTDTMAGQPAWVGLWLYWLLVGAFILPAVLMIWKESRVAGAIALLTSVVAGVIINLLFNQMGVVKLLGLPHIVLWVPLLIYLNGQRLRMEMPVWPRRIICVVMGTLIISLAFDTIATMQYLLGDRSAAVLPS